MVLWYCTLPSHNGAVTSVDTGTYLRTKSYREANRCASDGSTIFFDLGLWRPGRPACRLPGGRVSIPELNPHCSRHERARKGSHDGIPACGVTTSSLSKAYQHRTKFGVHVSGYYLNLPPGPSRASRNTLGVSRVVNRVFARTTVNFIRFADTPWQDPMQPFHFVTARSPHCCYIIAQRGI
ncbi:hypothetical protein BD311DRAFT_135466 [Dichomitus squalens]|uniref:Uncharacterized protein n=1 Tax=Dichomitus squalens TaxID=114155 RepID=A0A4Q9MTQ5_9APHY|nr:hypothetical protein BD311DRAFT_135466 [Dichomitus squalens]